MKNKHIKINKTSVDIWTTWLMRIILAVCVGYAVWGIFFAN